MLRYFLLVIKVCYKVVNLCMQLVVLKARNPINPA